MLGRVWDEWLSSEFKLPDFEVSGILMGMKNNGAIFQTNRLRTARRLMKLWPAASYCEELKITPAISLITEINHKPKVKITLPCKINLKLPKNIKTSWAWLKGLWGSAGGLYFPKNGYYLTLIISDEKVSRLTKKIFQSAGLSFREHRNEITIRNREDIMTFLCNAGMPLNTLELEKMSIIRSARSRANIERNYEAANIARSVKAAGEQNAMAKIFLSKLSEQKNSTHENKLKELAELRIKNPDDSLEELGKKLNPPIQKSAVNYRWKKIQSYISSH